MLIHFLYATSPRAQSLRSIMVLSNKKLGGDSRFFFFTNKRQEILVYLIFLITHTKRVDDHRDAAHVQ